MSFDIPVKIDPGDSLPKIKGVEDGLARAEKTAASAQKAFAVLGEAIRYAGRVQATQAANAFAALGRAIEKEQALARRTTEIHQQLSAASSPLAKNMRFLADAMDREKRILDEIHRPVREYTADLAALDQLLGKNAISTQQYAEQVTRLNRSMGQTPQAPAAAPTMKGGASAIAGYVGLAGAAGAGAAVLGVGREIEDIVKDYEQLEDNYTRLSNRAQEFTRSGLTVNAFLDEQNTLAHSLNSTIEPTIVLYDAVGNATRGLGLSTKDQIALTKTLGSEMINVGESVDRAGEVMQELAVSLNIGSGAGEHFEQIMEKYPGLSAAAADAFGVSEAALSKMIETGKIGLPELAQAWITNGSAIIAEAQKHAKTNEELRAELMETANVLYQQKDIAFDEALLRAGNEEYRKAIEHVEEVRAGGKALREVLGPITDDIAKQAEKWKALETAAARALRDQIVDGAQAAERAVSQLGSSVDRLVGSFAQDGLFAVVKAVDPWFVAPETPQKIEETARALEKLAGSPVFGGRARLTGFDTPQVLDLGPHSVTGGKIQTDVPGVGSAAGVSDVPQIAKESAVSVDYLTAAWKRELDAQQKAFDSAKELGQVFAPAVDTLVDGLLQGELSAKKLEDALSGVAVQLLKMAAIQALTGGGSTGGFLTGILGGKTGFDYTVSNDPLQRPGFATGGDFMVRGPGGTDTRLIQFWATPGESVHVRTPEQRASAQRAPSAQPVNVTVVAQNNERDVIAAGGTWGARRVWVQNQRQVGRRMR